MASKPQTDLTYTQGCGDCGKRHVALPMPLPALGDDFDWDVRDYDSFRLFMLEEIAARFPERKHWTPADMEVVLIETLSVVLDQLSDMNDRIQAESFLETARRPDTVRRILEMIGYQPLLHTDPSLLANITNETYDDSQKLEMLWRYYPHLMEEAKQNGPRAIRTQYRMVTQGDYRSQLLGHPLVLGVDAYTRWTGSRYTHFVVVRLVNNLVLDEVLNQEKVTSSTVGIEEREDLFNQFNRNLEEFYQQQEIADIPDVIGKTPRYLLQEIIKRQRMVGQEVVLQDAVLVGIVLSISVRIIGDYYRSEIEDAVYAALVEHTGGFFAPGYLQFGEDVVVSDIIESVMSLDGISSVCVNRMKRVGAIYPDQSGSGRIVLEGHEIAVLEDNVALPERGALKIVLHGGNPG